MLTMKDIIREGHPTLRKVAKEVDTPLSEEDKALGQEMMEFLKNSQDPEMAEKYELRSGVGLAAPQINEQKRIIAVLIPAIDENGEEFILFEDVMYNPRIISHSVQKAALADGEGCLSIDRPIEGLVPRHERITVEWTDAEGNKKQQRFRDYEAIVIQHEIDHLNGKLFFDRIDPLQPYAARDFKLL
ncbi:peptide deformylase [Catellicoccus marimammalium]|uniref:Peptide deformylase n=1 Tax=Catellicoccus marimammalium M35/04/3 TaxID=1234409 RepID=K8ZKG8_9ENTE|nr:peptide deformylase [Catellicoccus marimammalium]EKU27053.1 Peptide deformylase [Catellicoccus marimammalium M35/04/3]